MSEYRAEYKSFSDAGVDRVAVFHVSGGTTPPLPTVAVEWQDDTTAITQDYNHGNTQGRSALVLPVAAMDALAEAWMDARAVPLARKRYDAAKAAESEAIERAGYAFAVTQKHPEDERQRWARYIIASKDADVAMAEVDRARQALEALGEEVDD